MIPARSDKLHERQRLTRGYTTGCIEYMHDPALALPDDDQHLLIGNGLCTPCSVCTMSETSLLTMLSDRKLVNLDG